MTMTVAGLRTVLAAVTLASILLGLMDPAPARELPSLGRVTLVKLSGQGKDRAIAREISDRQVIGRLAAFMNARRTGWGRPWGAGMTIPVVNLVFYDGGRLQGTLGVTANALTSQRSDGLYTRDARPDEIDRLLGVLGLTRAALRWPAPASGKRGAKAPPVTGTD
jgi:hypothetical protein